MDAMRILGLILHQKKFAFTPSGRRLRTCEGHYYTISAGLRGAGGAKKRRGGRRLPSVRPRQGRELWKCEYHQCHALIHSSELLLVQGLDRPAHVRAMPGCNRNVLLAVDRVGDDAAVHT